jgi:hypothetical protein
MCVVPPFALLMVSTSPQWGQDRVRVWSARARASQVAATASLERDHWPDDGPVVRHSKSLLGTIRVRQDLPQRSQCRAVRQFYPVSRRSPLQALTFSRERKSTACGECVHPTSPASRQTSGDTAGCALIGQSHRGLDFSVYYVGPRHPQGRKGGARRQKVTATRGWARCNEARHDRD